MESRTWEIQPSTNQRAIVMASGDKCKECGTAIPADSPGGFCAHCLLGLGLEKGEEPSESASEPREQEPNSTKAPAEATDPSSETVVAAPLTEKAGDRIDRYRLLQE